MLPEHGAACGDAEVAAEEVSDLLHRAAEVLHAVVDEKIRPAVELIDTELADDSHDIKGNAADNPAL